VSLARAVKRAVTAYPAMLRSGLAGAIAYRAEMVVWMLTTTMPLVSLSLWSAVAENGRVGRFSQRDFAVYFIAVLLVRQLTSSWLVWEMNQAIKSGSLAQKLLRPVHPLWSYSAENLGALPLRVLLCAPLVVLSAVLFDALPLPRTAFSALAFMASLAGAWLINFFTMALIGSLAFFVESSVGVFDLYLTGFMVFSGYLVPLDLLPERVRAVASVLPFRYVIAFPVEIATGALSGADMLRPLAIQWAFVAAMAVAALAVFRAGVRRFAAVGG
jgi:ABC-2 type transport system permease protein